MMETCKSDGPVIHMTLDVVREPVTQSSTSILSNPQESNQFWMSRCCQEFQIKEDVSTLTIDWHTYYLCRKSLETQVINR